jgi:hypothetical protein
MRDDIQFAPGFFDLRPEAGLGRLDARQLADIGVSRVADEFQLNGRPVEEIKAVGLLHRLWTAMSGLIVAAKPSHA